MKKNISGVLYNDIFRNLPEIYSATAALGERAIGRIMVVCAYLKHSRNALGCTDDLPALAKELCVRTSTLAGWLDSCGIFVVDHVRGVFYYPRYRALFDLDEVPSDAEVAELHDSSSRYSYMAARGARNSRKTPKAHAPKCAVKHDEDELKMNSNRFTNQLAVSQPSDGVAVSGSSSIGNGKGIFPNGNDTCNGNSSCNGSGAEEAGFDNFEKIISQTEWRKSVTRVRGVNLDDDRTLHVFARWMFDYCCANGTMPHGDDETRRYAFNLLAPKHATRRMFEEYLNSCVSECSSNVVDSLPANYEHRRNGIRHASCGEPLPDDAPQQPSPEMRWSYMRHQWGAPEGYDAQGEWQYEQRRRREKGAPKRFGFSSSQVAEVWSDALRHSELHTCRGSLPRGVTDTLRCRVRSRAESFALPCPAAEGGRMP